MRKCEGCARLAERVNAPAWVVLAAGQFESCKSCGGIDDEEFFK